jgi:hypothetical protein
VGVVDFGLHSFFIINSFRVHQGFTGVVEDGDAMKVFLFSVVGLWLCVGARWVFGAEAVVAAAGGSVTLSLEEFIKEEPSND